jgi:hypothetical protein
VGPTPERNQPVDVVLDGGWHLTALVQAVDDATIELGPLDRPLRLPGSLGVCGATVAWRTRTGAAQRHGRIAIGPDGTLRLEPDGEAEQVQRRSFVRVPALLSTAVIGRERLVTRTTDVSVGGMLVSPAESLELDEEVRFALDLGSLTISGSGAVVRATTDGARGVRFADLRDGAERAISRYVAQRQRELIVADRAAPAARSQRAADPQGG